MNKEKILGVIRHALTFGGGYVVARGYVTADVVPELVGAIITIIGTIWSVVNKNK